MLWQMVAGMIYPQRDSDFLSLVTIVAGNSFTTKPFLTSEFLIVLRIASFGDLTSSPLNTPLHSDFLVTSSISANFP